MVGSVDQVLDHLGLVDVGESFVASVVRVDELFVVEAELGEDGCVQVGGLRSVFDRAVPEVIGGSVSLSASDASTGQPHTESIRVMVSPFVA